MSTELQTVGASDNRYQVSVAENEQEFVTMMIGNQLFGISVMAVQDVIRKQKIAKVPLAPHVVAGSLNLRGRIVTAIDMRKRLKMEPIEDYTSMMNVVVEYKDELFSLLVDKVGDVLSLPLNKFEKAPTNISDSWRDVSAGVYKLKQHILVILDVENVIQID